MNPKFKVRDSVRVKEMNDDGNPRVPHYIRGKTGRVLQVHGVVQGYLHDHLENRGPLYSVIFDRGEIFGRSSNEKIVVDVHEGWLEASTH